MHLFKEIDPSSGTIPHSTKNEALFTFALKGMNVEHTVYKIVMNYLDF